RLLAGLGFGSPALEGTLDQLERQGKTAVILSDEHRVLALFGVADTLRETSKTAIDELHAMGVKTLMLTGDNPHTAQAIARQVGIDRARSRPLATDQLD